LGHLLEAARHLPGFGGLGRSRGRAVSIVVLVALLLVGVSEPGPLVWLRHRAFDGFESLRPRRADADLRPVAIVAIDETSLRAHGQWPWPRDLLAELVERIAAQQPAAIGIDVLFPEADRLSPDRLLERLPDVAPEVRAALSRLPSNDARFAASLAASPSVLAVDGVRSGRKAGPGRVPGVPIRSIGPKAETLLPAFDELLRSIPELSSAARGAGAISIGHQADGVVRQVPAAIVVAGRVVPSLGIEMLRLASGSQELVFSGGERGLEAVAIGDLTVPTDRDGQIWVPFAPHAGWRMVSASDVLAGRLAPESLAGRFVLIGATAEGTSDVVMTPLGQRMWGIEVHAQLLEAVLGDGPLRRPVWAGWAELLAAALLGGAVLVLGSAWSPGRAAALLAGLAVLAAAGAFAAFASRGLLLDPVRPIATGALLLPVVLAFTVARLERARRELDRALAAERDHAQRLEGELQGARKIQMGILPRRFPAFPSRKDFDVHALIVPARSVGGDLYDYFLLDEDHLFFMIGDVSGKGVPAALFMAITKALYKRNALLHPAAIAEIMTEANREIGGENSEMLFVTAFAGILDLRTGDLDFCCAGHDHPVRLRPGSPPARIEVLGGPPLCAVDDFEFQAERTRLEAGEAIVLFTDGVPEAMTREKAMYGTKRVVQALTGLEGAAPAVVAEKLYADVLAFADGAEPSDDVCILVIRRA
jgi:serine phosphatase RsbU (regulator of sigma subunit)/CHASE2 domain-containing sensor protein